MLDLRITITASGVSPAANARGLLIATLCLWQGQVRGCTASEEAENNSYTQILQTAKSGQRLLDAEGPFDNHCQQQRCGQEDRSGQLYRESIGCFWMTPRAIVGQIA
jgi:hypothetical protein